MNDQKNAAPFSSEELTRRMAALFTGAGYKNYKMRKFEEYSLYLQNKNFLQSEQLITFNDPSGRLLALKPDVTLSIVKNSKATATSVEKLYYTESVYRMDPRAHEFREIHQMGLELLGTVDTVSTLEVLGLALSALSLCDRDFTLNLSHMQIATAILDEATEDGVIRNALLDALRRRSLHDIARIAEDSSICDTAKEKLLALAEIHGDMKTGLEKLRALMPDSAALSELTSLYEGLCESPYADRLRLDFSMINDGRYYNGIIFQGYVSGIHKHVLSGGRYDRLAARFREGIGALGFAVYLSELATLIPRPTYDCDILLLYRPSDSPAAVCREANALRAQGCSVRTEMTPPDGLRPREIREVSSC